MAVGRYLVHIVAVDENNGIGFEDKLLFRISEDLKQFRRLTLNHVCIAGSKTLDTMPKLAHRTMVRLTRDLSKYKDNKDGKVFDDVEKVKSDYVLSHYLPRYIIGGGEVYASTLNDVDVIMMTRIHAKAENVDTWYPDIFKERPPKYHTEGPTYTDEKTGVKYSFHIYGYNKQSMRNFINFKVGRDRIERGQAEAPVVREY